MIKNEKVLNIAILGLGVVGKGLVSLLTENREEISNKHNGKVVINKVLERNEKKLEAIGLSKSLFVSDINEICNDKSISIVVELLGRIHPAKDYIEQCLKAGKNVVTANKDVISLYGKQLSIIARDNNVQLLYEASCLGAIPAINSLKSNFLGDDIISLQGIFNGTSNYILTKMTKEALSFEASLAQAQQLGYAESDPTNDVDGIDAAYKLCILCRYAFGIDANFEDVELSGIRSIDSLDIKAASRLNYTIKLIASANKVGENQYTMRVGPALLSSKHQLSNINDAINALTVNGNYSGEVTLIGSGAGSKPTASAVANDICSCFYNPIVLRGNEFVSASGNNSLKCKYYLRLSVYDKAGVLSKIAACLANNDVSVESLIQEDGSSSNTKSLIIITHATNSYLIAKSLSEIKLANAVDKVNNLCVVY